MINDNLIIIFVYFLNSNLIKIGSFEAKSGTAILWRRIFMQHSD